MAPVRPGGPHVAPLDFRKQMGYHEAAARHRAALAALDSALVGRPAAAGADARAGR